jgi:hypothetical protein
MLLDLIWELILQVWKFHHFLDCRSLCLKYKIINSLGFAGKNVKTDKIDKITGLDPTKRGFDPKDPSTRLAKGDARHVEV